MYIRFKTGTLQKPYHTFGAALIDMAHIRKYPPGSFTCPEKKKYSTKHDVRIMLGTTPLTRPAIYSEMRCFYIKRQTVVKLLLGAL